MFHEIEPTTLYYLGGNGAIYEWTISVNDNVIRIDFGQLNGAKSTSFEEIARGKGGRSLYGQISSRVRSRINTQYLKGYKDSINEAKQGRTNALDLPKPMLAQPLNKVKNVVLEDCFVQYKYNGNRCLVVRQGNEVIAYSRKGKIITSIGHITDGLDIPEDTPLDGELYAHGVPLQTIRSWISRKQEGTTNLRFHIYDAVLPLEYKYRHKFLSELKLNDMTSIVPTRPFPEYNDTLRHLLGNAISHGYEGLILRAPRVGYEVGKRSKSLIKVKRFTDAEFVVTDIYLSERKMPMATCLTLENKTFDVVLPGSQQEKQAVFAAKELYIGRLLTVEYSELTEDNIPFHPVAITWREHE